MDENKDEGNEGVTLKMEQEMVKLYKRRLENWREVLIHIHSLLIWEKPYYPGVLAGFTTFLFFLLWYLEPSVLTATSIVGTICCLLDYIVPILSSNFFDSAKWTGTQERKYESICQNLVQTYFQIHSAWVSVKHFKENKPKIYFCSVLGILMLIAWIGNIINNLFLTYLIVLFIVLFPGIKSQNIIQQNIDKVISAIREATGIQKKKK